MGYYPDHNHLLAMADSAPNSPGGLFALPGVCGVIVLIIAYYYEVGEPFGAFELKDAMIEIGGAALLVTLWILWFLTAFRGGIGVSFRLIGTLWCALTVWAVSHYILSYFHSPWAWYVPAS
jgi:hypothetical protein